MNLSFNENCESFDYNKKFELLNRLIEFTGLRYVGEWGHYTLPLGHFNGLPYLESNYFGDGVTIRRITNLDEVFLPNFNSTVETVYRMVMGITEPNWESATGWRRSGRHRRACRAGPPARHRASSRRRSG